MKKIVVFEPTDEENGLNIVDEGDCIRLEDTHTPLIAETFKGLDPRLYIISKKDIPFIIRGLQEFI